MSARPSGAERYLLELDRCLVRLPPSERAEIVAEIRSHLLERPEAAADPARAFGSAEAYARAFVQERALAGALAGGASWALGRALVSGASRLGWWYVVAVLAVAQAYGAVLVALAALKPVFPAHVGLFVGGGFTLGARFGEELSGAREVLGWWSVPLFLGAGVLFLWGGNFTLRALARWRLAALARARTALAAAR